MAHDALSILGRLRLDSPAFRYTPMAPRPNINVTPLAFLFGWLISA
jgi:hypothetical protein